MILEVVKYDHSILRKKGAKIDKISEEIKQLVSDMLETIGPAKGIGLASQQIGQPLQLAVIDITGVTDRESRMWVKGKPVDPEEHMPLVMINPEISGTKTKATAIEGCLSFPGLYFEVTRSERVKVKTQLLNGTFFEFEASGLLGRAVQHEYDHLQGKLYIDYLTPTRRREYREALEAIKSGLPVPKKNEVEEKD